MLCIWPTDGDFRVVPSNPELGLRVVPLCALVLEERHLAGHAKAVSKAWRYIDLLLVFTRQVVADPTSEGGRPDSDVNGNIEDLTMDYMHELALAKGMLEVKPSERTSTRHGEVVLYEMQADARLGISFLRPGLEKKSSLISENLGLYKEDLWDIQL